MSGVEDSVENYQSYLVACCTVMEFESCEIHFFSFRHSYLELSHDFHAQICFHSHFFTEHTSLGFRKCLIGMLFDRKPDKLLSRTLYRTHVAAHVILKVREEDAMNDALFTQLSNYNEGQQADWHIKQKVESQKIVLASRKTRSEEMKPCDFDKCEICINCKITHKQDNKLYLIKKKR